MRFLPALLAVQFLSAGVTAACYYPNGDSASNDTACNPDDTYSPCCGDGYACLSDGVCQATGDEAQSDDATEYVRGSCTDESWESDSCPQFCLTNNESGGAGLGKCPSSSKDMYYCTGDDDYDCDDGDNIVSFAGTATAFTTIGVTATTAEETTAEETTTAEEKTTTADETTAAAETTTADESAVTSSVVNTVDGVTVTVAASSEETDGSVATDSPNPTGTAVTVIQTSSSTSSSEASSETSGSSSSSNKSAIIGGAVGGVGAVLLFAAIGGWLYLRKRKRNAAGQSTDVTPPSAPTNGRASPPPMNTTGVYEAPSPVVWGANTASPQPVSEASTTPHPMDHKSPIYSPYQTTQTPPPMQPSPLQQNQYVPQNQYNDQPVPPAVQELSSEPQQTVFEMPGHEVSHNGQR
ncbi:hypothetical protein G7Z17_g1409 [Cylindrodendrum hubeiense]|uniref:Uncharacterized protein n=1 Tax=Cylindrodendrum hubeiense TaxID=595255 RepID=A0A9P5LK46_9HYPO|nr:hypothetical protein G7Z17_g1409 [Cylindrodendrum hubeiense]